MKEFIGVKGFVLPTNDLRLIKRDLLFFDRLAFFLPDSSNRGETADSNRQFYAELEWLIENHLVLERPLSNAFPEILEPGTEYTSNIMFGVAQLCELLFGVFRSQFLKEALNDERKRNDFLIELRKAGHRSVSDKSIEKVLQEAEHLFNKKVLPKLEEMGYIAPVKVNDKSFENSLVESIVVSNDYLIRADAIRLNDENYNAVPLLSSSLSYGARPSERKTEVVQLVVNSIPIPDLDTPWEKLLDFKTEPQSRSARLALRNWITEVSVGQLSIGEIEEKLEYLLDQYASHMKVHKIDYRKGILETMVTATAEVVEHIAKLRLTKLAAIPFSFKTKAIKLMQEELKAPGKEIAYIHRIKNELRIKD